MPTTTEETIGMIIEGAPFVHCAFETKWEGGKLVLRPSEIRYGKGGDVNWNETQTAPGGWSRQVPHVLDTRSVDPTRASALYVVIDVDEIRASTHGYGGGPSIVVKRLNADGTYDPDGEEIYYTRRCAHNTDLADPVLVVGEFADKRPFIKAGVLYKLTPEQRAALGV